MKARKARIVEADKAARAREVEDEFGPATSDKLLRAKERGDDEYYTAFATVEKMARLYEDLFEGKRVCLPCDDAEGSNFWRFFSENFAALKLAGLTGIRFDPNGLAGYALCQTGPEQITRRELMLDGDFRSYEVGELMAEADIVATNPPFALIRDFTQALRASGSDFIFLGPVTCFKQADLFEMFKEGRAVVGESACGGFIRPDGSTDPAPAYWITSFPKREFEDDEVPDRKFDNYDALHCRRTEFLRNVPADYDGLIGVPLTYLHKHDPNRFELVCVIRQPKLDGKKLFDRIGVRRKRSGM